MREVAEQFVARVQDTSEPLWWPGLASTLLTHFEAVDETFLPTYTTSNFVAGLPPQAIYLACPPSNTTGPRLQIECLTDSIAKKLTGRGLVLLNVGEATVQQRKEVLEAACTLIGQSVTLSDTVEQLARAVHLLHQNDPRKDISFSDPKIPLSVFISVPMGNKDGAARTAEGIIHEVMHLQLSLVEHFIPLAKDDSARHYSPWKREYRPVSGLMHALYVFGAIKQWLNLLECRTATSAYASRRKAQIALELKQVNFSPCTRQLTAEGLLFWNRLVA